MSTFLSRVLGIIEGHAIRVSVTILDGFSPMAAPQISWFGGRLAPYVLVTAGLVAACDSAAPKRTSRPAPASTIDDLALEPAAEEGLPPGVVRRFGTPRLVMYPGEMLWGMGAVGDRGLWLYSGGGGNHTRAVFRVHGLPSGSLRLSVGVHRAAVEVAPNGRCAVLGGANRYQDLEPLRAFDLQRGHPLPAFVPEMRSLPSFGCNHAVSADCHLTAGYTKDRQLALWRLADGRMLRRLPAVLGKDISPYTVVEFPEGAAVLTLKPPLRALFTATGSMLPIPPGDKLVGVSVSSAAGLAAARYERGPAALFHLPEGRPEARPWASGMRWIVLGSAGKQALGWDGTDVFAITIATGRRHKLTQAGSPRQIIISAEDSRALIVDGTLLRVFDLKKRTVLLTFPVAPTDKLRAEGNGEIVILEANPDPVIVDVRHGKRLRLAKVEDNSHVAVFHQSLVLRADSTGEPLRRFRRLPPDNRAIQPGRPLSSGSWLSPIRFSPDGRWLGAFSDTHLTWFSLRDSRPPSTVKLEPPTEERTVVLFGETGIVADSRSLSLVALSPGRPLRLIERIPLPTTRLGSTPSCALSSSQRRLGCVADDDLIRLLVFERRLRKWKGVPATRSPLPYGHHNGIRRLRWWKDRWVVTAETMEYHLGDEVIATDVQTSTTRVLWRRARWRHLECGPAIGPDGHIAAGGQGQVRVWRSPDDPRPTIFRGLPDRCIALHVLKDGTVLALMNDVYAHAQVLSLRAGAPPRRQLTLAMPDTDLWPLAFSPGGRYLATTHQESSILVWRLW